MTLLDLSWVLILHMGFVHDDLVVALDDNIGRFFYGPASVEGEVRIRPEAFRDYGYLTVDSNADRLDIQKLDPSLILFGPEVIDGVRGEFAIMTDEFLDAAESPDGPTNAHLKTLMCQLDKRIGSQEIISHIAEWARQRGGRLSDVCLVIIPDDTLYHLPLGYLGLSENRPLMTTLAGVTIDLSLIAMKWRVAHYHWGTLSNCSKVAPRCAFFGADALPSRPLPDLTREADSIVAAFGSQNSFVVADGATTADFAEYYSSGDICWFAGHGAFRPDTVLRTADGNLQMPLTGPVFMDGPVTNFDLLATSDWNFEPLWLTVMNACVLGKALLVGQNPLGFVSSLYGTRCASVICAMWSVCDPVAILLAKNLAEELARNYGSNDFPRARSLSSAIRKSLEEGSYDIAKYMPYSLWGLP